MREECSIVREMLAFNIVKYGRFRLSSGRETSIYIDMREALGYPSLRAKLLSILAAKIAAIVDHIDIVAGIATGGIPWATMLAHLYSKPLAYIRESKKDHGLGKPVEGASIAGKNAIIVDDVATTGQSILKASKTIAEEGGYAGIALVVLDREEGARELLASKNIRLLSALKMRDIEECQET